MRRLLTTSLLVLALVISVASAAPTTHAAGKVDGAYCEGSAECASGFCKSDGSTGGTCQPLASATAQERATATAAINAAAQKTPITLEGNPDVSKGFGPVMTWVMGLFAWLVGVAALVLNYAVYYTVVTMGDYVHNLTAVGVTWRILRDISNIALIFGFLGIGISVILNTQWYGGKTKMLPMLIVAAVFLNFSLFITQAVIDAGNLFATQFYTQINGGTLPTKASLAATTAGNEGISNKIMSQLGFQSIYNPNPEALKGDSSWLIAFMGIILFLITAFVMLSLAFVLITRFVYLLFLMIIAPIGFAGLAVPQLKGVSDWWWSSLFKQTITAPVLLLLLYIALTIITDANFLTGFSAVTSGDAWLGYINNKNIAGFAGVMISFLVAMGLLLYCVIAAKQLGAFGAAGATKLAGKLTFGATAWGMRKSIGGTSQYLSRKVRTNKYIGSTTMGRHLATAFDKGAKASFDVRGATLLGGLKGGLDIDAGKAQEGGYRKTKEENIKKYQDYAKSIGEAYDETGPNKKEQTRIDAAEAAHKQAQEDAGNATRNKERAEAAQDEREALVKGQAEVIGHLEEEELRLMNAGRGNSPEHQAVVRNLAAAKLELQTREANLATAKKAFETEKLRSKIADREMNKAKKEEDDANNVFTDRKKGAQRQYAYDIQRSWVDATIFHGSGASAAAKKIIKDTKKSERDRLVETIQSFSAGKAAPAAPAAPAAGGGAGSAAH